MDNVSNCHCQALSVMKLSDEWYSLLDTNPLVRRDPHSLGLHNVAHAALEPSVRQVKSSC